MKVFVKEFEVQAFWYDGTNFFELTQWLKGIGRIAATLEPDGVTVYLPHSVVRVPPCYFLTVGPYGHVRFFSEEEFYKKHRLEAD
jgi:hypothetical protein